MSGYLSLVDGRLVPVRDGVVIGRVAGCDVVIDDPKASRRHARFHVESGVVEIEDLQSSNGTLLNGHPVTRRLLRDGDQVRIGKTVLTYHEGDLPGMASPAAPAARRAAPSTMFDDDNDLFAGTATEPTRPAPAVGQAPAPAPPARPAAAPAPAAPAPAAPAASRAAPPSQLPPPPRPAVVEFADEVVEVRKQAPPAPSPASRPAAAAAPVATTSRVLQFQKQQHGGGLLGDDLSQLSGGTRSVVYAVVLLLAAGIVWGIITLMR